MFPFLHFPEILYVLSNIAGLRAVFIQVFSFFCDAFLNRRTGVGVESQEVLFI